MARSRSIWTLYFTVNDYLLLYSVYFCFIQSNLTIVWTSSTSICISGEVYKATPKGRKDLNLTSVCHAKARLSTLWLHILIQGLLRTEDKEKDFQFCRMPWTSSSGSLVAPRNLKGMSPMRPFNFLNFAEGVDVKDITSHVQQSVWKCFVHYMFPFIPQSGNRLPTYFRAVRYLRYETSYFFRDVQRAAMRNFHGYASCLLTVSWI